jgi:hypothetical protein
VDGHDRCSVGAIARWDTGRHDLQAYGFNGSNGSCQRQIANVGHDHVSAFAASALARGCVEHALVSFRPVVVTATA